MSWILSNKFTITEARFSNLDPQNWTLDSLEYKLTKGQRRLQKGNR